MKIFLLTICVTYFAISFAENARYDNYHIYSVKIENDVQLTAWRELQNQPDLSLKFLKSPNGVGQIVHLIASPHKIAGLSELFETHKFKTQIRTDNLQRYVVWNPNFRLEFTNFSYHLDLLFVRSHAQFN